MHLHRLVPELQQAGAHGAQLQEGGLACTLQAGIHDASATTEVRERGGGGAQLLSTYPPALGLGSRQHPSVRVPG